MKFIIAWFVKKFGVSVLITTISVFYISAVIAFYSFVLLAVAKVYHLIQKLLDYISNIPSTGGGSDVLSLFSSLLNASGFSSALNDNMPLITSALVFVLTKFLWRVTNNAYRDIIAQASRAANLYV